MRDNNDWIIPVCFGVTLLIMYMQPSQVRAAASDVCSMYSQGAAEAHTEIGGGRVPIEVLKSFQGRLPKTDKGSLALAYYKGLQDRVYQSESIDREAPVKMVEDAFRDDCTKMVYIFEMNRIGR